MKATLKEISASIWKETQKSKVKLINQICLEHTFQLKDS